MPDVLHESTGLRIVKNSINRFAIVTLHYTADPVKRTKLWKQEAAAGMAPARWAKEYEMDYTALYGQRVFPEIAAARDRIVVPEPYQDFGAEQTFWGGFDFGSRNPSSFHVYTIIEGVLHAIWELYEPCKSIPDLAGKIRACPYFYQIKYIACDPTIIQQKSRPNKFGILVTLADLFYEEGIRCLIPGNTDEPAWLEMMRKHWADPADPTFRIWARCPAMISEFENAVYQEQSDREVLFQTYREQVEDAHNHAMDDAKYLMNSKPGIRIAHVKPAKPSWQRWMK